MSSRSERSDQPADEEVSILVADSHVREYAAVVGRCKQAGLHNVHELPTIGVINGSIATEKVADLEHIEGVASVERQTTLGVAPPESDVQAIDSEDDDEKGRRRRKRTRGSDE